MRNVSKYGARRSILLQEILSLRKNAYTIQHCFHLFIAAVLKDDAALVRILSLVGDKM